MELQVLVQNFILSEDEREADHTDWYEPKLIHFRAFIEQTQAWMTGGDEVPDDLQTEDSISQVGSLNNGADGPAKTSAKAPSKVSTAVSKASSRGSRASRPSLAQIQAEVDRAAIHVKAQALQEKHALGLEELQLRF